MTIRHGIIGSKFNLEAKAAFGKSKGDVAMRTARRAAASSSAFTKKKAASSEWIGGADGIICGRQQEHRWQRYEYAVSQNRRGSIGKKRHITYSSTSPRSAPVTSVLNGSFSSTLSFSVKTSGTIPSSYSTLTSAASNFDNDLIKQTTPFSKAAKTGLQPSFSLMTTTTTPPQTKSTEGSHDDKGEMDDEYGAMTSAGKSYTYPSPYYLESFGMFGHYPSIAGADDSSLSSNDDSSTTTATTISAATNSSTHSTVIKTLPRGILNPAFIKYNTYGTLNAARDNVIVVCHALTGNASLEAWWGDLLGPGKAFDTDQYFVVCCNILGSCYGSAGPESLRPGYDENNSESHRNISSKIPKNKHNQPIYGIDFPDVSVRDTVRLQLLLLKNELKINSVKCVIGGSFGGMQCVEYCVMAGATRPVGGSLDSDAGGVGSKKADAVGMSGVPYGIGEFTTKRNGRIEPFVRSAVPIACGAAHTAWQIGISETQRQAIYADPKWKNGRIDPHDPPHSGLSVARQVAMVSYRTPLGYHQKFGRALTDESMPSYGSRAPWQVKSYLEYQGKKFLDRFDPVTYVKLTEQMDSHDVGRGRGTIEQVLSHVEIPVCILGIDSDVLYPLREQEELARCMPHAELKIIHSDAGHDGFLLEQDQVAAHIKSFLYSHE